MKRLLPLLLPVIAAVALAGCPGRGRAPSGAGEVVAYTSLDRPYAEPVLKDFERETGVRVLPVYDTEADKSLGLANRIRAEMARPQADVFWSSEVVRMAQLKTDGALEAYASLAAADIPARFRDSDGFWTGFAGRARVFAYHQPTVKTPPRSHRDLEKPAWRGQVAMANPRFGTTASEVAALFQVWGDAEAKRHFLALRRNGVRLASGNAVSAEWAARGEALIGLTDTDDAFSRQDQVLPVGIVYPDQDGEGTLVIPNTVALVKGAPHDAQGKRLVDYLLRPETELRLARLPSRQIPLHDANQDKAPPGVPTLRDVKAMPVDWNDLARRMPVVDRFLREQFER